MHGVQASQDGNCNRQDLNTGTWYVVLTEKLVPCILTDPSYREHISVLEVVHLITVHDVQHLVKTCVN